MIVINLIFFSYVALYFWHFKYKYKFEVSTLQRRLDSGATVASSDLMATLDLQNIALFGY